MPLDLSWVNEVQINRQAVQRRAAELPARRAIKTTWQLAWLIRGIQCMDLTTLSGDDTPSNVARLCRKAADPIRHDILEQLGVKGVTCGAICVYPNRVQDAVKALGPGTPVAIASVAAGFPAGQTPLDQRLAEIRQAVRDGATEIDIVINRTAALTGDWQTVYDEVRAMREACGHAHLKTILATGELATYRNVYKASLVAMMAGSDFIKTSTGKEKVNATLEVGLVMCRAIRDFYTRTGFKIGFKPAGGIRSAKDVLAWLALMYEELGEEWTRPHLFRLGASVLLPDIERQLFHGIHGVYANIDYIPMA